jgi:signal transduction histidine kinase
LKFEYKTTDLDMMTDKNMIRNILYNLLSNAAKYSEDNTTITCTITRANGNFLIAIRDEGIGIPEEDIKHIGTRFFRSSNAVNVQGTGLGLNIVQSYLNFLKGDLSLKNNEGKGTTFTLLIPSVHEK